MAHPFDIEKPNYLKALEATQKIIAREVSAELGILKGVTATMEPLSGADDLRIKTSKSNFIAFNRLINHFLYEKGRFEGIQFTSFEDFESKLAIPDKEILVALLLDASYTKLPKRATICPECGAENSSEIVVADIFNHPKTKLAEWQWPEPFYEKIFSKDIVDGVLKVNIRYPSESQRNEIYKMMTLDTVRKNLLEKGEVLDSTDTLLIFIDSIEMNIPTEDGKSEQIILRNKLPDIRGYLDGAPTVIHTAIKDFIDDTFKEMNTVFYHSVTCVKCAHQYDIPISPENEFFRQALY